MKKLFFTIWIALPALLSSGQYNISSSIGEDYCHHQKAAENQIKTYYSPYTTNSLLQEYDVKFYFLDLAVENNTIDIAGNVTVKAVPVVESLDTFAFELTDEMIIESVLVNGNPASFQHGDDLGKIPVVPSVPSGELFTVQIYYHGTPPSGGFFSGVSTDYNSDYDKYVTWSLSEPYAASDWWPTKRDLQDKIDSVWVFLTTSPENMAGSQGLLTGVTNMPNGKKRFEWKSHYPIDFYLISFAVSDYQEYNIYAYPASTDDSVLIQNFIYDHPDCLPDFQEGIDRTVEFVELYSDLFGLYPFIDEKYGHCLTELGGGMEHQTMTTIGGFGFGLVAHELGHMWFGDKVTCATWSDIWINEGFATYTDYLAHSYLTTPYYDSLWLKIRHDQVKSQPGGSVYVPEEDLDDIGRIFSSRLSYSKGALLLHMIRFELQDDSLFYDILRTYLEEYGDSVATGDDFREWVEYMSGEDFTDFFDQWYYGEGYPIYDIVWHQDTENLYISSTQTTSTAVTTLFKMTVPYFLKFTDGTDTTLLLFQDANLDSYTIPISKTIDEIRVDPKQWILHTLHSIVLGIEETESPVYFSLGPNPAKEYVTIYLNHFPGKDFNLQITDLTGRLVLENLISDASNSVNISGLPGGIYIVSLTDGKNLMIRRLVVE